MTGSGERARAGRLVSFASTVVLTGVVSVVTIPIVIRVAGATTWASLSIGQSIGASIGLIVAFGWGLTGPASVALRTRSERPALYLDSLVARAWLIVPALALEAAITAAIAPSDRGASILAGAAAVSGGLSANWFFIGASSPGRLLLLDTAPKVAGTAVGAVGLLLTSDVVVFALGQLAGMAIAVVVSSLAIMADRPAETARPRRRYTASRILGTLAAQRHGVLAVMAISAFVPLVLGVVSVASPASLPLYALADRILRFATLGASPVIQLFQGWVPRRDRALTWMRMRTAGAVATLIGVVGAALFPLVLVFGAKVLTHSTVQVPISVAIAFGAIFFGQVIAQFLSSVALVAVGREAAVARSNVLTLAVTVPVLLLVAITLGGNACVWPWLLGQAALIIQQSIALAAESRRTTLPVEVATFGEPG